VLGDMFHAGMLGYYAQYITLGYLAGLTQKAHHYLPAGTGSLGYEPKVDYFFGTPRAIEPGGIALNTPIVNVAKADTTDQEATKNYTLQIGMLSSALEHAVPEQMFADPASATPPDAISAVKALAKASAAGQRIYQLTQANQASTLPNIHHDSQTLDEIHAALATGKEVITHTDAVSVPGWSGAGYIILDPTTGNGAYKIGGGANGSFLDNLFIKGLFYIGAFLSLLDKNPGLAAALDAVVAGLSVLVSTIVNLIELVSGCNSVGFTAVIIFSLVFATLIFELALIATGVGFVTSILLGLIVGQLENMVIDWAKNAVLCKD
jgi:hypothetical protein